VSVSTSSPEPPDAPPPPEVPPLPASLRPRACPQCDYRFDGLPDGVACPECGFARDAFLVVLRGVGSTLGKPTPRAWSQTDRIALVVLVIGVAVGVVAAMISGNTTAAAALTATLGLLVLGGYSALLGQPHPDTLVLTPVGYAQRRGAGPIDLRPYPPREQVQMTHDGRGFASIGFTRPLAGRLLTSDHTFCFECDAEQFLHLFRCVEAWTRWPRRESDAGREA
jgi:hypothetical protein